MEKCYRSGEQAYINGRQVLVLRQVLFNRPAYRVRAVRDQSRSPCEEWVVDGLYLSDDPSHRVGLVAMAPTKNDMGTHAA